MISSRLDEMQMLKLTLRFSARAIDRAMLVFPTPGGPWKQRILPWVVPFNWLTAMNSCGKNKGNRFLFETEESHMPSSKKILHILLIHQCIRAFKNK